MGKPTLPPHPFTNRGFLSDLQCSESEKKFGQGGGFNRQESESDVSASSTDRKSQSLGSMVKDMKQGFHPHDDQLLQGGSCWKCDGQYYCRRGIRG
jgi:hypothetical protein